MLKEHAISRVLIRAALFAVVAFAAAGIVWAQVDPRIGTWELNIGKSKYSPGPPPSKEVRTYAAAGQTLSVSVESTDSKGNRVSLRYAAGEDGKDHPLTGLASADAIAMKRIDARTFEADTKKSGKVIGTTMGEISKDGKNMTLTFKSVNADGQVISNIAVYDKK